MDYFSLQQVVQYLNFTTTKKLANVQKHFPIGTAQSLQKLTADSLQTGKESGIEFICANKDKVTIDYSLKTTLNLKTRSR